MGPRRSTHHRDRSAGDHDVPGARRDSVWPLHAYLPADSDLGDLRVIDPVWGLAAPRASGEPGRRRYHDLGRAADHGPGVSDGRRREYLLLPLRRADPYRGPHPRDERRLLHRGCEPRLLLPAGARAQRRVVAAAAGPAAQSVHAQLARFSASPGLQHGGHRSRCIAGDQSRTTRPGGRRSAHRGTAKHSPTGTTQRRHRSFDRVRAHHGG